MHVRRYANFGLLLGAIFSMTALIHTTTSSAGAQTIYGQMWQAPIDEAWEYGISWHWDPDANRIVGWLVPQLVIESVEDGMIKGRIATASGTTLPLYGKDSVVIATFFYDSGASSPRFFTSPEKGEFSIEIPEAYSDADYVKIFVNSHSFDVAPSGDYPEAGVSTIHEGPTNRTSTTVLALDDGLEGTIDNLVTEESMTTTEVIVDEESVVTITTIKSLIEETTTETTPIDATQISAADEEVTSESSTVSNASSSISTSSDERITTVTNSTSTVSTKTETTSTDESIIKITTVSTNSTKVIAETVSLAFKTNLITAWDNHKHFKIDGYYVFDGEFKEQTYYQPYIPVSIDSIMSEHRLVAEDNPGQ